MKITITTERLDTGLSSCIEPILTTSRNLNIKWNSPIVKRIVKECNLPINRCTIQDLVISINVIRTKINNIINNN